MSIRNLEKYIPELKLTDLSISLWSGCGQIQSGFFNSHPVIVKLSEIPENINHQVISQSDFAKQRKDKSYLNEINFYNYPTCHTAFEKVRPYCYFANRLGSLNILILEDFKSKGFQNINDHKLEHIYAVVKWLAQFHAQGLTLIESEPFPLGGYWHLETRPDEFEKMEFIDLKHQARYLADSLYNARYQTLIHGDSKLANYAFDPNYTVLGYDFQYVGSGIGLQDVMLFMTSVFDGDACAKYESSILNLYFESLLKALSNSMSMKECELLEHEWRTLWPIVWSDFYRFLNGWKPEHKKITQFMQDKFSEVLNKI
ncbi:kinase [Pseudoalteromonas sp. MTN2-4]|uniref:kinase n=1 Tax=Pseudoalteromonas sp. MTN2-4 TaxID=3056555 RepID=UPI0036F21B59